MDHHCPWVGTCVGAGNHKSFLLFLFYTLVGSVYSFIFNLVWGILCLYRTSLVAQAVPPGAGRAAAATLPFEHPTILGGIAIGLGCAYTFIFAMATGSLLVWQLEVAATNVTTIESYMQDRYLDPDQKRQGRWKHIYDLGRMANLRSFLGPRVAQWLLPINHPVDGLTGWRYAPLLDAAAEVTDDEFEELEEAPPDPEPLPGEGRPSSSGDRAATAAAPRPHHGPQRAPMVARPPSDYYPDPDRPLPADVLPVVVPPGHAGLALGGAALGLITPTARGTLAPAVPTLAPSAAAVAPVVA